MENAVQTNERLHIICEINWLSTCKRNSLNWNSSSLPLVIRYRQSNYDFLSSLLLFMLQHKKRRKQFITKWCIGQCFERKFSSNDQTHIAGARKKSDNKTEVTSINGGAFRLVCHNSTGFGFQFQCYILLFQKRFETKILLAILQNMYH